MTRRRLEDYETPTVEAAAMFEEIHGEADGEWERVMDARDARRDAHEDEKIEARKLRQMEREGRP